jgi:hypothetical protein
MIFSAESPAWLPAISFAINSPICRPKSSAAAAAAPPPPPLLLLVMPPLPSPLMRMTRGPLLPLLLLLLTLPSLKEPVAEQRHACKCARRHSLFKGSWQTAHGEQKTKKREKDINHPPQTQLQSTAPRMSVLQKKGGDPSRQKQKRKRERKKESYSRCCGSQTAPLSRCHRGG